MSADNRYLETLGQLTCQKAFDDGVKVVSNNGYEGGSCSELIVERRVLGRKDSVRSNPLVEVKQLVGRETLDFFIRDFLTADE